MAREDSDQSGAGHFETGVGRVPGLDVPFVVRNAAITICSGSERKWRSIGLKGVFSFPLIIRELRVQSRKRTTYRARFAWGLAATIVLGFVTWNFPRESTSGRNLLSAIHGCLGVMLFAMAPLGAADSISREKREGTFGLLLLTNLSPMELVTGKLAAHFFQLVYFVLMMLPFMMIPVLLGGVTLQDFLLSSTILFVVAAAGLSAGIIASAMFVSFSASLLWALLLNMVFIWLIAILVSNAVRAIFSNTFPDHLPWAFKIFALGPLMLISPVETRDFLTQFFASTGALSFVEAGLVLLPLILLGCALRISARKVAQYAEFAGETARRAQFRQIFLTRLFWRTRFRNFMNRKLDRNPFIWLEYRSAWARAGRWGLVLLFVATETMLVVRLPFREDFLDIQFKMLCMVIAFMTLKSSSSFQREKESGAFELLLVTPLTEKAILSGRLRAVWGYYLPPLVTLVTLSFLGLWWVQPLLYVEGKLTAAVNLASVIGGIFTIPICGLLFALRYRTFLAALLWTSALAIFAPICFWHAFSGLVLFAAERTQWSVPIVLAEILDDYWWPVILGIVLYHVILALLGYRFTLKMLQDREFGSRWGI